MLYCPKKDTLFSADQQIRYSRRHYASKQGTLPAIRFGISPLHNSTSLHPIRMFIDLLELLWTKWDCCIKFLFKVRASPQKAEKWPHPWRQSS